MQPVAEEPGRASPIHLVRPQCGDSPPVMERRVLLVRRHCSQAHDILALRRLLPGSRTFHRFAEGINDPRVGAIGPIGSRMRVITAHAALAPAAALPVVAR